MRDALRFLGFACCHPDEYVRFGPETNLAERVQCIGVGGRFGENTFRCFRWRSSVNSPSGDCAGHRVCWVTGISEGLRLDAGAVVFDGS